MKKRLIVLDTSGFIAGYEPEDSKGKHYTVPEVIEELRDEMTLLKLGAAIDSRRLRVQAPEAEFKEKAKRIAEETGDLAALSAADLSVLSLALQLKESNGDVVLVSEDYSVQNIASRLEIRHLALSTRGISSQIVWIAYCPGCRRTFKEPVRDQVCPVCGTKLERKPLRKRRIRDQIPRRLQ